MKRKEQTIVEKEIPGREHAGYAYIYPLDGGARQEYVLEMTPENIANFIGAHQYDAEKIILTDMLDNLILDTAGGFIMNCPHQILCGRILPLLAPIQMGRRKAKDIFRSHDYRHTIATCFYDSGVSLQSIRDYLGHDYEEMTEQYIDYMPKKIEKASEGYFSRHSLASYIKRGEEKDG